LPPLDTGNPGAYELLEGWYWYNNRMDDMRDEGWKLHVSGTIANAQLIMDLVLPVLRWGEVAHKVLPDTEAVKNQSGEQVGKFLAVYPDSIIQAFIAVSEIDNALGARVKPHDSPAILHEKRVGRTVVYTRYGAFASGSVYDPRLGRYVNDTIGQLKPEWIENPWIYYPNVSAATYFDPWPTHDKKGRRRRGRI